MLLQKKSRERGRGRGVRGNKENNTLGEGQDTSRGGYASREGWMEQGVLGGCNIENAVTHPNMSSGSTNLTPTACANPLHRWSNRIRGGEPGRELTNTGSDEEAHGMAWHGKAGQGH